VFLLLVGGIAAVVISVLASRSKSASNLDEVADLREKLAKLGEEFERLREEVARLKNEKKDPASSTSTAVMEK
jgi:cell shape-determining protein MreC